MKKKPVRKKASGTSNSYTRYLIIGFVIATILFITVVSYQSLKNANVLGTSVFLAKDGGSGNESSGSEDSDNSVESNNSGRGSSGSSGENIIQTTNPAPTVKPTEAEHEKTEEVEPSKAPEQEHISPFSFKNLKELRVRTKENKTKIRLDLTGGKFELENENGRLKIKVKQENGDKVEIENDSLHDINEALREEGIHIATTSGNGFRIRRGGFEAETHFPLSINPTTNQLTVTTPAGEKNVAVLPDQAVANLFRLKFIDKVASDSATGTSQNISLGLLNDRPTFQIKGLDDQKFLGFLPVSIKKISFVSAQTGLVIKTNEDLVNRILDIFSFQ